MDNIDVLRLKITSIQGFINNTKLTCEEVSELFAKTCALDFIECHYDALHMLSEKALLNEIKGYLSNRGIHIEFTR